jgi:hypothetical protein
MERKTFAQELHKRAIKKYPRRKVTVFRPDEIWAVDLASMESLAESNDGYKWILCIVDVFSKYAFCVPLKTKSAQTVLAAMKEVVKKSGRSPEKIWCDRGSEFYNKYFKEWIKSQNITMYSTYGESKSAVVERFIRTLRELLAKKFTASGSTAWVKMLPNVVKYYNHKFHKSIQMSPLAASDPKNAIQVFLLHQSKKEKKGKKPNFHVGDPVRISVTKEKFEKGSTENWSREVFAVYKVLKTNPITYKLLDRHGDVIEGSFYAQELQKTAEKFR